MSSLLRFNPQSQTFMSRNQGGRFEAKSVKNIHPIGSESIKSKSYIKEV